MRRVAFGLMVSVSAIVAANPSLSADLTYPTDMRGSYNSWDEPDTPLMDFEAGLRYMYSRGGTSVSTSGDASVGSAASTSTTSDTAHFLEGSLRVNDRYTNSYLKGYAGYSVFHETAYSNDVNPNGQTSIGKLGYVVVDFGYKPISLGDDDAGLDLGGFVGYQYIHDAPTVGGANFYPITSNSDIGWSTGSPTYTVPVDHADHSMNVNALRLGVVGEANVGAFDVTAEIAAIPYASVTGVLGSHSIPTTTSGGITTFKATESKFSGSAWGAATDLTLGYNITENFAVRVGGRATYLRGQGNLVYGLAGVSSPYDSDGDTTLDGAPATGGTYYLTPERIDALSLWRYGLLAEIAVKF